MSSPMCKGILWGLPPGPSQYSMSWDARTENIYILSKYSTLNLKPKATPFMSFLEFRKCPLPQWFLYTKSSLGAHWRLLYITLLTLLVFSEMSYATLSFCTLQDKRILYICLCVCVYVYFVLLFTCKFEPMTRAWTSPKRLKGGVWPSKWYTKSRILKTPIDHPYRLCCVQWDVLWNFFVLHFTGHYICLSFSSHASLNPWPLLYLI
jgi:hypothetical protein